MGDTLIKPQMLTWQNYDSIFKNIYYLFIFGALGLRCCTWVFSSCNKWRGGLFIAVCRLLIAMASLVAEHRL